MSRRSPSAGFGGQTGKTGLLPHAAVPLGCFIANYTDACNSEMQHLSVSQAIASCAHWLKIRILADIPSHIPSINSLLFNQDLVERKSF